MLEISILPQNSPQIGFFSHKLRIFGKRFLGKKEIFRHATIYWEGGPLSPLPLKTNVHKVYGATKQLSAAPDHGRSPQQTSDFLTDRQ